MPQSNCEQSDYKLCFKLKQHTPLIHFQADQKGATLRATELKPKLDRFLLTKLGDGDYEEGIEIAKQKKWIIGKGEHPALDYKVRITGRNINIYDIAPQYRKNKNGRTVNDKLSFPIFFASIDKEWNEKSKKIKFSYADSLELSILILNKSLKKFIKENIATFFFLNNFGMRQSKGFGSFTVANSDIDDKIVNNYYYVDLNTKVLENIIYNYQRNGQNKTDKFSKELDYDFIIKPNDEYKKYFLLFKALELFYKTLRSGANIKRFYFKSLLFLYAKEKLNTQWDKKLFKSYFLNNNYLQEQLDKHNSSKCKDILTYETDDKYLLRDCLGLATIQEYNKAEGYHSSEKFTLRHPSTDTSNLDRFNDEIIEPNDIVRFQSPLIFKPIRINEDIFRIYLIHKDYPQEIFEKNLTVLKVKGGQVRAKLDGLKFYPNFNLKEYLDFAFSRDITKHIQKCGTNTELVESQLLRMLYSQLNKQYKTEGGAK